MAEPEYIKLTSPRQRGGFAVVSACRSSLWLGPDHLLSVESEGYTESYKRFYFRDIQAITMRKTGRIVVLALVSGCLSGLCGIVALAWDAIEAKWVFGILAGIFAVPFVLNLLYGPTCACQLRTAVQTEDLPSLGRVRRVEKILTRLRPLIAEAQGQLSAEAIPPPFPQPGPAPTPTPTIGEAPTPGIAEEPPRLS